MKNKKYKGVSVNILGLPTFNTKNNKKDIVKRKYHRSFVNFVAKQQVKNLMVIYDIPETMKKERDWFRRQLKNFNFLMIQRSVWVGPAPLPKDFLDYIKMIGLEKKFKTFKLAKSYLESSTL